MYLQECETSLNMVFKYLVREDHRYLSLDNFSARKTRYLTIGHYRALKQEKLGQSVTEIVEQSYGDNSHASYFGHGANLTTLLFALIATQGLLVPGLKLSKLTGFKTRRGKTTGESAGTTDLNQKYVSVMPINGTTKTFHYSDCRYPDFTTERKYAERSCNEYLGYDFREFPSSRVPIIIIGIANESQMIQVQSLYWGERGVKLLKIIAVIVLQENDLLMVGAILSCFQYQIKYATFNSVRKYYDNHELNPKAGYTCSDQRNFFESFFDVFKEPTAPIGPNRLLKTKCENLLSKYKFFIDKSISDYYDIDIIILNIKQYAIIHNTLCEELGSHKKMLDENEMSYSYDRIKIINERIKENTNINNIFYLSYLLLLKYCVYFSHKKENVREIIVDSMFRNIGNIPVDCILEIHSYATSGFFKITNLKVNIHDLKNEKIEKINKHISTNPNSRTARIVESLSKINWLDSNLCHR